MTSNLELTPANLKNQLIAVQQERRALLKTFWLGVTLIFLIELFTAPTNSILMMFSAILISLAALLPVYLWCSGKALGLPVFPVFALTYVWTYAIPLVSNNLVITTYSELDIFFCSLIVAGFLGLGTFIWFLFVKSPTAIPKSYRVLIGQNNNFLLLGILAISILFNLYVLGGWLLLDSGSFALIRGVILSLNVLSVFALSYRCGTREISKFNARLCGFLVGLYTIINAASLLLVGALSTVLLAAFAFILGRKQVPWLTIILVLICFLPLHYGKQGMRQKYWSGYETHFIQIWEYPAWYAEWIGYGFDYVNKPTAQTEEKQSLLERASLMQLLLLAETKTPTNVPYLSGATYAILPQLLVPRIFKANKITSHEGTYLLNIHYGKQTRADTKTTTIGWGLLNEAYANFGVLGCAGLAMILGVIYGHATRWSMNTPLLSARSLWAILLISFAFQTEFSAGVYVAALFQSVVPLTLISFFLMKVHRSPEKIFSYYG